jgi:phage N-6-adenine-methyltransferase
VLDGVVMAAALPTKSGELLPVEQARAILQACTKVDEVKRISDKASAIRLYLRRQRAALDSQNHATEIMLHSQARLGEMTDAMERAPGGRGKTGPKAGPVSKLAELQAHGITKQDASRWAKLAEAKRNGTLDQHIGAVKARSAKLTVSGAIAAVSHAPGYDSDEWYTPDEILDAIRRVLGTIDIDVCSCKKAQERVRAKRWFSKADDARTKQWKGRAFFQPPFSQPLCNELVSKFLEEHHAKRLGPSIALLNASTDTSWFHDLASLFPACFTRGRISFLTPRGERVEGNRVGQVLFYTGPKTALFREVFEPAIGTVLLR